MTEEADIGGVALRVIGTDKREQRALPRAVRTAQCPSLASVHLPRELMEYDAPTITYRYVVEQ